MPETKATTFECGGTEVQLKCHFRLHFRLIKRFFFSQSFTDTDLALGEDRHASIKNEKRRIRRNLFCTFLDKQREIFVARKSQDLLNPALPLYFINTCNATCGSITSSAGLLLGNLRDRKPVAEDQIKHGAWWGVGERVNWLFEDTYVCVKFWSVVFSLVGEISGTYTTWD